MSGAKIAARTKRTMSTTGAQGARRTRVNRRKGWAETKVCVIVCFHQDEYAGRRRYKEDRLRRSKQRLQRHPAARFLVLLGSHGPRLTGRSPALALARR